MNTKGMKVKHCCETKLIICAFFAVDMDMAKQFADCLEKFQDPGNE